MKLNINLSSPAFNDKNKCNKCNKKKKIPHSRERKLILQLDIPSVTMIHIKNERREKNNFGNVCAYTNKTNHMEK